MFTYSEPDCQIVPVFAWIEENDFHVLVNNTHFARLSDFVGTTLMCREMVAIFLLVTKICNCEVGFLKKAKISWFHVSLYVSTLYMILVECSADAEDEVLDTFTAGLNLVVLDVPMLVRGVFMLVLLGQDAESIVLIIFGGLVTILTVNTFGLIAIEKIRKRRVGSS